MPGHRLKALRQPTPGILLGFAAIVFCLALRGAGWLEGPELSLHDRFVRQGLGRAAGTSPVVAISIGEAEFQRYGYPIPDAILAKALERVGAAGATAIGVDLYRDGPASGSAADLAGWDALGQVMAGDPRIVASELLPSIDEPGTPAPEFAPPDQVGFNNLLLDRGRVVRRGYLFAWDAEGIAHPSLSLRLALIHLASEQIGLSPAPEDPSWLRIGKTTVPPLEADFGAYAELDAGGYQFPLDFARSMRDFETIAFARVVEGDFEPEALAGRVALIGTDAPSVKDDFNAPYQSGPAVKGYRLHAHITDQLIRMARGQARPIADWSELAETSWILAWGLAGIAVSAGLGTLAWAVPSFLAGLALLYFGSQTAFANGTWIPVVAPSLAWISAGGLMLGDRARREAREQRQVMGLFRRFASRKVADQLWRQRDEFMEGGKPRPQRVTITALLSDLKGYTAAAEKMEPDALMAWIDSYMNAMTRVIEAHGGQVDDYVGDGIKANFGVPIPSESEEAIGRDACQAVHCALAMGDTLAELNADWAERGWPQGRQRVGLHTGPAVVGAIGSEERLKYTSVGDTINTAARLESIGGSAAEGLDFDRETTLQRILIGASTRRALGERFELESLGAHAVKGKSEPLEIYRVIGERPSDAEEGLT